MKLALLGYMGSGKSTIGKALADHINFDFFDLDQEIEKSENQSISELFEHRGEIFFRKEEVETLSHFLNIPQKMVLSLGGGTPCYGNTMQLLQKHEGVTTIYLKASVSLLTERLWNEQKTRPMIAHLHSKELLNDFIRKHLFERGFFYNQSDIIISTDEKSIQEIVESIVVKLF